MIAETISYLEAIEYLPPNGTLLLHNVAWEDYENLLEQMAGKPAHRVSYNDGVLKIMSPRKIVF